MRKYSIRVVDIGAGQWHIENGLGQSIYLPKNHEIISVAEDFGMHLRHGKGCSKGETDGTVDCPECGRTYTQFFKQAYAYLSNVVDYERTITDPGYFWE